MTYTNWWKNECHADPQLGITLAYKNKTVSAVEPRFNRAEKGKIQKLFQGRQMGKC
jgi:hypothetical protein